MPDDAQWLLHSGLAMMAGAGAIIWINGGRTCRYVDESDNNRLRRSTRAILGVGAVMSVAAIVRWIVSGGSEQRRRLSRPGRAILHSFLAILHTGMSMGMLFGANGGALLCNS